MHRRFAIIVLSLSLVATACGSDEVQDGSSPGPTNDVTAVDTAEARTGAWPHDFVAPLVGGATFDAGDYEGQDLVLWFWAPW